MYDRIAVPLDGSVTANRGIGPGRRLAHIHDARLVFVSVATSATGGVTRAHNLLSAAQQRSGLDVDTVVLDDGDAASALARFDAADSRTLLCMTTRGRGAARRALLGTTALAVVRHSPHAVVLVGPRCDPDLDTAIDPIITCLDGSVEAEDVLPWVTAWSEHTDATIMLVRVTYPVAPPQAGVPPTAQQLDDLDYLTRIRDGVLADHPDVCHITVAHDDPALMIRRTATGYPEAMFAVATSHPGRLTELVSGSTAAEIIRTAEVPVLIVSKHGTSPPPT